MKAPPRVDWLYLYITAVCAFIVWAGGTWQTLAICAGVGLWLDLARVLVHEWRAYWRERRGSR